MFMGWREHLHVNTVEGPRPAVVLTTCLQAREMDALFLLIVLDWRCSWHTSQTQGAVWIEAQPQCSGVRSHTASYSLSFFWIISSLLSDFWSGATTDGGRSAIFSLNTVFEQKHCKSSNYLHLQYILHLSAPCFSSQMSCKSGCIHLDFLLS